MREGPFYSHLRQLRIIRMSIALYISSATHSFPDSNLQMSASLLSMFSFSSSFVPSFSYDTKGIPHECVPKRVHLPRHPQKGRRLVYGSVLQEYCKVYRITTK